LNHATATVVYTVPSSTDRLEPSTQPTASMRHSIDAWLAGQSQQPLVRIHQSNSSTVAKTLSSTTAMIKHRTDIKCLSESSFLFQLSKRSKLCLCNHPNNLKQAGA